MLRFILSLFRKLVAKLRGKGHRCLPPPPPVLPKYPDRVFLYRDNFPDRDKDSAFVFPASSDNASLLSLHRQLILEGGRTTKDCKIVFTRSRKSAIKLYGYSPDTFLKVSRAVEQIGGQLV